MIEVRAPLQYAGRSGPIRDVLEVTGGRVLYAVGTRDGSREASCSVETFRRWATGPGVEPWSRLPKPREIRSVISVSQRQLTPGK